MHPVYAIAVEKEIDTTIPGYRCDAMPPRRARRRGRRRPPPAGSPRDPLQVRRYVHESSLFEGHRAARCSPAWLVAPPAPLLCCTLGCRVSRNLQSLIAGVVAPITPAWHQLASSYSGVESCCEHWVDFCCSGPPFPGAGTEAGRRGGLHRPQCFASG